MPPKWTDVASALILCCSKCKIHSKCGKSCCDCEIEPQQTPRISPQSSTKQTPNSQRRAELVSAV